MHEASLAYSILETVRNQCTAKGYTKILEIRLRIGQGSGVQADSLHFAFDIVKKDTIADQACLIIEQIPLGGHCKDCGRNFTIPDRYILQCPHCGCSRLTVTDGFEMDIIDMEVE